MVVLRKANSHSVVIYILIKKINNVNEDPKRKTDSNFDFPKLPNAYEVLTGRNIITMNSITRSLNIVATLTKNKDRKQLLFITKFVFDLCFLSKLQLCLRV